jgi:hypothetical protein
VIHPISLILGRFLKLLGSEIGLNFSPLRTSDKSSDLSVCYSGHLLVISEVSKRFFFKKRRDYRQNQKD